MKRAKDVRCEILVSIKQDISFRTKTGFETTLCPGKAPMCETQNKIKQIWEQICFCFGQKNEHAQDGFP